MFGATAQGILYRSVLSRNSQWLIALLVLPPWLLIYTVSFFKTPPVGPRRFRRILTLAMCWYAGALLLVEILRTLPWISHEQGLPIGWARLVAYGAIVTYIAFIWSCIEIKRYESQLGS